MAFPLADLRQDPRNARMHGPKNRSAVRASLERFGWRGVVVALSGSHQILAGHARVSEALALGWTHAPVLFVNDAKEAAAAFALADNRTSELAEWDDDVLRELLGEGVDFLGFDERDLAELLGAGSGSGSGDGAPDYSKRIKSPIYHPTRPAPPPVATLVDHRKALELIAEIDAADLPAEVAEFLRAAARRHSRFNYGEVAEFYSHAGPEVQRLMEASALVIIDFRAAVEAGFVQFSSDLGEIYDAAD